MDWNSIKIFSAIAENGSLAAAARELNINHSTVFRRLNTFEDDIGGRLFERFSHGYELTPMGEDLFVIAKRILHSFDEMQRHIVGKDIQPKGLVKITAPNNIAYSYLPRYLAEFKVLYPDIHVDLLASNQEFNMDNRQADIAVRVTSTPPDHLIGKKVSNIGWSVYGSKKYQEQNGFPQNIQALDKHALIGALGNMQKLPAFVWLEKHHSSQVISRSDDLVAMSYLAESGQGLAFLPDDQQRPGLVKVFTFEPGKKSQLWLLTHPDLRGVVRIKLLLEHLKKSFVNEKWL